jgi:hypothetical protein
MQLQEQVYQTFLEENTRLIPREFIQNHGIHFDLVLRKLSLARDYTTDLFYLAKSSADWNCVLIEIEKPQSRYFKDSSNAFHPDFQGALEQINTWRAWFADTSQFDGFINGTIRPLRVPITMAANPCHIRYVLVHGRRSEFEKNETRRRLIYAQEREDFHILSYDSLLESLHAKSELYVGRRVNERIDLLSEKFAGESIILSLPPEYLRLNPMLRQDILAHRSEWIHFESFGGPLLLEQALPLVQDA